MRRISLLLIILLVLLLGCNEQSNKDNDVLSEYPTKEEVSIEELRAAQYKMIEYGDELLDRGVFISSSGVDERNSMLHIEVFDLNDDKAEVIYEYIDKELVTLENVYHSDIKTVLNAVDGRVLVIESENSADMTWYSYDEEKLNDLGLKAGNVIEIISTGMILTSDPGQGFAMEIKLTDVKSIESKSIEGKLIGVMLPSYSARLLVNDEYVYFRSFLNINAELIGDIVEMYYIGEQEIDGKSVLNVHRFNVIEEHDAYEGYVESVHGDQIVFNNSEEQIIFNIGAFNKDFEVGFELVR
ncbi:hypothetical protein RI065_03130 [Mycoplasmatota bacterium zrk1]